MAVTGWGAIILGVYVAFQVDEFILGTSLLGDDLGPVPTWTDITDYVQSFDTKRGRQRSLERFPAGTATFQLDNTDGRFDPTNVTSPYVGATFPAILPGLPVRVLALHSSGLYDVWHGYANGWDGSWAKHHSGAGAAWATLTASGSFDWAAGLDPLPVGASGGGELSGIRMTRILDSLAWDTQKRTLDTGTVTMQASTLEGVILDQLQVTAESEGGIVFEGPDGGIVFYDRDSQTTRTESVTSQATFGDGPGESRYYDISTSYNKDLVKNDVILGRQGSDTRVEVMDDESVSRYGPRTYTATNLQTEDDTQLEALADQILAEFKDAEIRFDQIVIKPQHDQLTLYPLVFGLGIQDRITVIRRPKAGNTIEVDCFVESVAHNVSHSVWTTTFGLSSAHVFTTSPFILGSSLLGGTDTLVF